MRRAQIIYRDAVKVVLLFLISNLHWDVIVEAGLAPVSHLPASTVASVLFFSCVIVRAIGVLQKDSASLLMTVVKKMIVGSALCPRGVRDHLIDLVCHLLILSKEIWIILIADQDVVAIFRLLVDIGVVTAN